MSVTKALALDHSRGIAFREIVPRSRIRRVAQRHGPEPPRETGVRRCGDHLDLPTRRQVAQPADAKDHQVTVKRELDADLDPAVRALVASLRSPAAVPRARESD
jgi:hypothetical protein